MTVDSTKVNNLKNDMDARFEKKSNKVTSISSNSTDNEYPTAKCMYDLIGEAIAYINQ